MRIWRPTTAAILLALVGTTLGGTSIRPLGSLRSRRDLLGPHE